MTPAIEQRLLYVIVAGYLILATIYSIMTPIFEASDELWHYPMVKYIADTGQLPVQDPANIGPWRQEGSQPPLYYMLAALLTAGIDTSDMDVIRRPNPHADIGLVLPDGNVNMITHRDEPWRGTVLAVHVVRFFSIALGLGTILVTYMLGHEIFPDTPIIRLGAAALVAFLPMFLFISGSVNNDNLSNLLGNLLLLLVIRLMKATELPHWRDYATLGIITGAGLLSKLNIGFMIPLVALALLIVSVRLRNWRPFVIGGLISGGLTIVIGGWWYLRNQHLYGDPTGLNMFLSIVGRRSVAANLAQLWAERHSFTQAYWGFFGGVNVPLPDVIYFCFNIIGGIGLIGALTYLVLSLIRSSLRPRVNLGFPAAFTLAWPFLTFVSYLRWTAETPASQGRLIFGAIAPISMWLVVGLSWWLPGRVQAVAIAIVSGFFALIAIITPFAVIAPAYRVPDMVSDSTQSTLATFADNESEGSIELLRAEVISQAVQPEGYVLVETDWRIGQPLDLDWSLFVHLVTLDGVIISQRDIYPAQGLLATSDLAMGDRFGNPVAVRVPLNAYAPITLDVNVGWYHLPTGARLQLDDNTESYHVGHIQLLAREGDLPNPAHINFGDMIELVGYELTDLSPAVGETIELTLYWRGLRPIDVDYKVFANILDPKTLTKYAASDTMPAQWTAPTSSWQPGQIVKDTHTLTVAADAPPGIYELELGLYEETTDGFPRLRIHTEDGGQADNFVYLSRVRIVPSSESSVQ